MPGAQGGPGTPGVETPIPIQVVGDQGPLSSELQPKKVEVPVNAAPETAATVPNPVLETKSADGSPLDDALRQVDAAAGTAKAVDAVVSPTAAAGLSVQGEGVKTAATRIAEGDHAGLEADLVANNVIAPPVVSGEDQPEPEEAEVIPEKDEQEVAPEPVVPAPPMVTASEPAEPSRPITTGEPPIDYHEPVSPPAEPLPPVSVAPAVPAMPTPQPPAPAAPAYPLSEPAVAMPKATGLPVPPDGGPVVGSEGLQQPERKRLGFAELTELKLETIEKLIDDQKIIIDQSRTKFEAVMAIMEGPVQDKNAFSNFLRASGEFNQELAYSDMLWKVREIKILEEYRNPTEQGPVAAGGIG